MNPNSRMPPPTDHGIVEPILYSFDLSHRRVQEGGWTHQVTERELRSSTESRRRHAYHEGRICEMHWHIGDEWAIMLKGDARVLSPDGSMFIDDVQEDDLWIFPAGYPHSIQGTGENGCEFLLVFNQGDFSEESTFLLSDWLMHTPPEVLQKNFGLGPKSIAKLPKDEPLYIFPIDPPTQTLEQDRAETEKRRLSLNRSLRLRPVQCDLLAATRTAAQKSLTFAHHEFLGGGAGEDPLRSEGDRF